ncbi:polysaccharide deacetylase family protein [Aquibacillus salsiterrae]|uniref:Polysaccharide deacetylase family protein n=1 Tax=Aquibacillus salsiterrae TaxID=2950439 RepID=A0A9X3WCH1_9BACI|nr:polysaccharide deacetylase family protein [Aquibacillus salsiterrae]MDC3416353.1 polysaccharide deacetylase family protein [Aquibacillus salsiterrae]
MKQWILTCITFFILLGVSYDYLTKNYTYGSNLEVNQIPVSSQPVVQKQDELLREIQAKRKQYEEDPEDAKIDKVWKKMPGRNGLQVNVEKSYQNMKEAGKFNKDLLVYDQIEPEVTLKDLPPSPIYRGHPKKKMVSLNINVAWGGENIPSILSTLKKQKVKATFFIEGKWASKNTKLVKMILEEGHLIGNHAYDHPDMNRLSKEENRKQIARTNEILEAITNEKPKWFAPPSGSFNNGVVEAASEMEMETILWSVDTIDWKKPSTSVMVNRVMNKLHPGAMILMHPTDVIEQGLEELIVNIKDKGYKIGTVDRLLSEKRY